MKIRWPLMIAAFAGLTGPWFLAPPAHAIHWANQFVEFELPPQWQCALEGTEWVCQNMDPRKKRDAIIILAAKLKGDQDSLDQYLAYLKSAKTFQSSKGGQVRSSPKWAKIEKINEHPWVDSLHLESEVPGFYTRYLATVKQDIGVLVTYSINKDKYQQYLKDFDALVRTLKVFRKSGGINARAAGSNLFQPSSIPKHLSENTVFPNAADAPMDDSTKEKPKSDDTMMYLLIGGVIVIFFLLRRRES